MTDFSLDDLEAMMGKDPDPFGSLFKKDGGSGLSRAKPGAGGTSPTTTSAAGRRPVSPAAGTTIPGMGTGRAASPGRGATPQAATAPVLSPSFLPDEGGSSFADAPMSTTSRPGTGGHGRPASRRSMTAMSTTSAEPGSATTRPSSPQDAVTPGLGVPYSSSVTDGGVPPRPASVVSGYSIGTTTSRQQKKQAGTAGVQRSVPRRKPVPVAPPVQATGMSWLDDDDDGGGQSEIPPTDTLGGTGWAGGATSRATSEYDLANMEDDEEDTEEEEFELEDDANASFGGILLGATSGGPSHGRGYSRAASPEPVSHRGKHHGQGQGKSLAEMELELHGQLVAVTEELKTQEYLHKSRIESDEKQHRDMEAKQRELQAKISAEKEALALKTRDAEQNLLDKKNNFTEAAQVEVAALRAKHGEIERNRKNKIVKELQADIHNAEHDVSEVVTIRGLLSRGVTKPKALELARIAKEQWRVDVAKHDSTAPSKFDIEDEDVVTAAVENYVLSKEGIAVLVEDSADVSNKVTLIVDIVRNFLLRARDGITGKLKAIISEELRTVVNDRYATRTKDRQQERIDRRELMLEHQRDSSERFKEFVALRHRLRQEEKQKMLTTASENHRHFVEDTRNRLDGQIALYRTAIEEQQKELLALQVNDLRFLEERHAILSKDDGQCAKIELEDLHKRLDYGLEAKRQFFEQDRESLRLALDLEAKAGLGNLGPLTTASVSSTVHRSFRSPFENSKSLKATLKELDDQVADRQRVLRLDTFEGTRFSSTGGAEGSGTLQQMKHQVHQLKEQLHREQEALYSAQLTVQASLGKTEAQAMKLVGTSHDSMLAVRAELTEVERTKLLWEKELRLMLSDTAGSASSDANGGASPSRLDRSGRVIQSFPGATRRALFAQEDSLNDILSSLSTVLNGFSRDVKKRSEVLKSGAVKQAAAEEQFTQMHDDAERSVTDLFHAVLRIPKMMEDTRGREDSIILERARVEAEKTILMREEEAFDAEREKIEVQAQILKHESLRTMSAYEDVCRSKEAQDHTCHVLEEEHQQLLSQQSVVQKELRSIHKEHQRVDSMMARLAHAESTRYLYHGPTKSGAGGAGRHVRFGTGNGGASGSGSGGVADREYTNTTATTTTQGDASTYSYYTSASGSTAAGGGGKENHPSFLSSGMAAGLNATGASGSSSTGGNNNSQSYQADVSHNFRRH